MPTNIDCSYTFTPASTGVTISLDLQGGVALPVGTRLTGRPGTEFEFDGQDWVLVEPTRVSVWDHILNED